MNGEKFRMVPSTQLAIEQKYQRSLSPLLVNSIAKNFDPEKAWPIKVNVRNGTHYIMDGQHRFRAGLKAGIDKFLCQIWEGKTIEEEARFFHESQGRGSRRNLTSYQLFVARIASGDEEAIYLSDLCKGIGIEIQGALRKGGDLMAVTALETSLNRWGDEALIEALRLLHKAWSHEKLGFMGNNIMGMSYLCMTCSEKGRALDPDRFASKIKALSPNDIKRLAHQMPRLYSGLPYRNYAAAFLQEYIGRYQSGGNGNRHGWKIREGLPTIAEILNVTGE